MSGHDPEEDIQTTVAVSFIADLESSLVRALGQEKEYRRLWENSKDEIKSTEEYINDILQCKKIQRYRELEIRFNSKTAALKTAIRTLKHYGPPHPEHSCNSDTNCDLICDEYAKFEMQILELKQVLKG